jgi:hypothetical protein
MNSQFCNICWSFTSNRFKMMEVSEKVDLAKIMEPIFWSSRIFGYWPHKLRVRFWLNKISTKLLINLNFNFKRHIPGVSILNLLYFLSVLSLFGFCFYRIVLSDFYANFKEASNSDIQSYGLFVQLLYNLSTCKYKWRRLVPFRNWFNRFSIFLSKR